MFLVSGKTAAEIPYKIKLACAVKVNKSLIKHSHTMLQFTIKKLLESINKGWAVIALGESFDIIGFAQLWQYGYNKNGQQVFEFGSWLSFKNGFGGKILKEAVLLGRSINSKAQIVAIVEKENLKAQRILKNIGAEEIGSKFSPFIRTVEGEAAYMKIFDITKVVL